MIKNILTLALLIPITAWSAPSWVEAPEPIPGYITGIGLGENIEKAKQDAMADIAKSLYSNVSSSVNVNISTSQSGGNYQTEASNSVDSSNVLLPKVTWKNIAADEGIYYAMGVVSQSETVALYESSLQMALKPFGAISANTELSLNDYLYIQANESQLTLASERAIVIQSQSKQADSYLNKIAKLFDKRNQFAQSTCFEVKKSRSRLDDKFYLPAIESAIQSDKFALNQSSPSNQRTSCIPVQFRAKTTKSGKTIANVSMQLTIGSPASISKVVHFQGQSTGSYKSAIIDAADNFSTYFTQHGGLLHNMLNKPGSSLTIEQ